MLEAGGALSPVGEALVLGAVQDGHAIEVSVSSHLAKKAAANYRTAARAVALPCSVSFRRMRFLAAAAPEAAWGAHLVGRPPAPKEVASYKGALRLALRGRGRTRACP
eukprot:15101283-Alexandrium_andersonii.AAC.1